MHEIRPALIHIVAAGNLVLDRSDSARANDDGQSREVSKTTASTDPMAMIRREAALVPFPPTRGHLSSRRDLITASINFVDHQAETKWETLWSRHACLQLHGEEEHSRYVDRILDECTPIATLLLNAVISDQFDSVFNRSAFKALNLSTFLPTIEGIYFVGAFKTDGKLLFGYVGRTINIHARMLQHQRIITSPEEDPNHQELFYVFAKHAHASDLQVFYQPLTTLPAISRKFTTAILEPVFATALGTYQMDLTWMRERAEYDIPAMPYFGANSTACQEI